MEWKVNFLDKNLGKTKDAILIAGLPGIGNVGKIAVDFLVEQQKAKKICTFFSQGMPHSVFVNDQNLVQLPSIALFHAKIKSKDIFLLGGDVQPGDERSCYQFCEVILDLCKKYDVKEIVTIGGIGLQMIPKKPKVYCTATDKAIIAEYKKKAEVENKLYGIVGPIVGVSGLLIGLAKQKNIPAATLLAETFGHPMYLGVKGGREILQVLEKKFDIPMNFKKLDHEIEHLDSEILKRTQERKKQLSLQNVSGPEQNYIG